MVGCRRARAWLLSCGSRACAQPATMLTWTRVSGRLCTASGAQVHAPFCDINVPPKVSHFFPLSRPNCLEKTILHLISFLTVDIETLKSIVGLRV